MVLSTTTRTGPYYNRAAITIYLLSGTAGMASSLPGGIGINEASTVMLLGHEGVPATLALSIALLRRLITLWSMVALAGFAIITSKSKSTFLSKSNV